MPPDIHRNSSDSAPISNPNLSPTQAQVIADLTQGRTITAAARKAGIHRTTIHHWFRRQPEFKAAVETARSEYVEVLSDEMLELASGALQTLRKLLKDGTPSAVRLKTALAILERPGWLLPERDRLAKLEAPHPEGASN